VYRLHSFARSTPYSVATLITKLACTRELTVSQRVQQPCIPYTGTNSYVDTDYDLAERDAGR